MRCLISRQMPQPGLTPDLDAAMPSDERESEGEQPPFESEEHLLCYFLFGLGLGLVSDLLAFALLLVHQPLRDSRRRRMLYCVGACLGVALSVALSLRLFMGVSRSSVSFMGAPR